MTCELFYANGKPRGSVRCPTPSLPSAFHFPKCCVVFLSFFLHMCVRVIVQSSTMMVSQKQTEGSCLCEVNSTAGVLAAFTARGIGKERNKKKTSCEY